MGVLKVLLCSGYFIIITVRSEDGPGWPGNDGLDELPRAAAHSFDGELEFDTILQTPCR